MRLAYIFDYSPNDTDPHEGNSSAAGDVQKSSDTIVLESVLDELEVDDLADEDEENALGGDNSGKPSKRFYCRDLYRVAAAANEPASVFGGDYTKLHSEIVA